VAVPGTALQDVTFVVLDLETTGGSPDRDRITEIGALKLRGGELLGRIDTLVNPGVPIPPTVTVLTGITEAMVLPAPALGEVLSPLLEFLRGSVIVGHNIRFDRAFLDAACAAHGHRRLPNLAVDTLGIARRLVTDDVPDLRLQTLARHFRTTTEPVHRAYADAAATAELFHTLLEHAATWGVLGLDDLVALPHVRRHTSTAKLALTATLPRAPGVYVFRGRRREVLYVGKAANVRARARGWFSGAGRRQVPQMLRETVGIDHRRCHGPLEAAIRELRLLERHRPRFNKPTRARRAAAYVKLVSRPRPRLSVGRTVHDGDVAVGPFSSCRVAQMAAGALEWLEPDLTASGAFERVHTGLTSAPAALLEPLAKAVRALDDSGPPEHADALRARHDALARAFRRHSAVRRLRAAGPIVLGTDAETVELRDGLVVLPGDDPDDAGSRAPHVLFDEMLVVARWLARERVQLRGPSR
jgi:DNA polymerase-3 subunit epsilon